MSLLSFPSVTYLILSFVMLIPSLVNLVFAFKKQKGAKEGYAYARIEYRGRSITQQMIR